MAAQALGARVAAAALLTNTIREINRYKDKPDKRKRLLQSKLDKLYNLNCIIRKMTYLLSTAST